MSSTTEYAVKLTNQLVTGLYPPITLTLTSNVTVITKKMFG